MRALVFWLGLMGCPRAIPDHLRLDGPSVYEPAPVPTTAADALAQLLDGDPMWRDVQRLPDDTTLALLGLGGVARLRSALLRSEMPDLAGAAGLAATEAAPLGAVWLAGLQLGAADAWMAMSPSDMDPGWRRAVAGLAPLVDEPSDRAGGLSAAAWLGDGAERVEALRASLERRVWVAWLGVPRAWLGPPVAALRGWWGTPFGGATWQALLTAKATAPSDAVARARARAGLITATGWALEEVVADDPSARAAWRARVQAASGVEEATEAVRQLLRGVHADALADAGSDASVARGMVAGAAQRLLGACDDVPCAGLDRGETLNAAARLDAEVSFEVRVWRAIALRAAVDRLEFGHDTAAFPRAAVDLTDALIARALPPTDVAPLTRRRPDLWAWASWGEGLGAPRTLGWDDLRAPLVVLLEREATALLRDPQLEASWRPWVEALAKPPRRPDVAREL